MAVEDVLPVGAGQLGFEVDHGAEWGAAAQLGRDPGVPVADGGEGAVEVALVHGPGDAGVAGAGTVGPVPEEAALLGDHFCTEDASFILILNFFVFLERGLFP